MNQQQDKVQEFYPYPDQESGYHFAHALGFSASWIIGIELSDKSNLHMLGTTILVYAISILLDFLFYRRRYWPARLFYMIFNLFTSSMILATIFVMYGDDIAYTFFKYCIYVGRGMLAVIWIGAACSYFELHDLCKTKAKKDADKGEYVE